MPLRLLLGPAGSGKVGRIADRFLSSLAAGQQPVLVAPSVPAATVLERELAERAGALLGGSVITLDGLADRILARSGGAPRPPADPVRLLLMRRVAAGGIDDELSRSASFGGFERAVARFADECAAAGVAPEALERALGRDEGGAGAAARLYAGWHSALADEGLLERGARLVEAARRLSGRLEAWDGAPVLVYGFDDLAVAQRALLEALAARADVLLALPYEPGRGAFDALLPTVERLAATATAVEETPPAADVLPAALRALERGLFSDREVPPPPIDGSVRLLEIAGARGEAETIAAELARLCRSGVSPDDLLVVVPSPALARGALAPALEAVGIPYSIDARLPLRRTVLGRALLGLCRFAWLGGSREDLFAWLRWPGSSLRRSIVDSWEGKVRGRGRRGAVESYELVCELAGREIDAVDRLRRAESPLEALREVLENAAPGAFGLQARVRTDGPAAFQVRAWRSARDAVEALASLGQAPTRLELVAALEEVQVRTGADRPSGRVRIVGYRRARVQSARVVILAGFEHGRFPEPPRPDAFLGDERRRALERDGIVLDSRDTEARDRYLLYTSITRAREQVLLLRRAADDRGAALAPSPFWNEIMRVLQTGAPPIERRGLGDLTHPLDEAPSEREQLRALARQAGQDPLGAARLAQLRGGAWPRRLARARSALQRPTRLTDPALVAVFGGQGSFSVSDLEAFLDCSQRWFVERVLSPRDIDAVVDGKLKGSVAHAALQRFFSRLPAALGKDALEAGDLERARPVLREAIADSIAGQRQPAGSIELLELERTLDRDLSAFLRTEIELEHRLVPRRLEVVFGSERAAPGLKEGLVLGDFAVRGRIDRVDVDPLAARGLVQDYKYSPAADGAVDIRRKHRLQLPLYVLALRDLLGLEPVGGVYRPLRRGGTPRGLLRADARDDGAGGFAAADYLDDVDFWAGLEAAAADARLAVKRIRRGDVRHDPSGGSCPTWCQEHSICRIPRP